MTELDEIAANMPIPHKNDSVDTVRNMVRRMMPGESEQVIDGVTDSLMKITLPKRLAFIRKYYKLPGPVTGADSCEGWQIRHWVEHIDKHGEWLVRVRD